MLKTSIPWASTFRASAQSFRRYVTTTAAGTPPKKDGDISSVFASLSATDNTALPSRFASVKQSLLDGHEEAVTASFHRLLRHISAQLPAIRALGSATLPSISFSDLRNAPESFTTAHRETGVAIVRSVVAPSTALSWLGDLKTYITNNPTTKGFPRDKPAVYELYWSRAQLLARSHPNLLETSRFLMSHWHSSASPDSAISTSHPISYADRLRIRPPGDTSFALGPHVDGGSVERWETPGYGGLDGPYGSIFRGRWEEHDPFEASRRLAVRSDLYSAPGNCSAFRMYQGWLSLARTAPGGGTLRVNPLFRAATAYYLLRPFFEPREPDPRSGRFLEPENWALEAPGRVSAKIEGAWPGHGQELSPGLHPHLELGSTMVSVPEVEPGDYIAWHCDAVHAVDAEHRGTEDASVLYVPACPLTEGNAEYLARQREAFVQGVPGPDFPGGVGEGRHVGRAGKEFFEEAGKAGVDGVRAMGLGTWDVEEGGTKGERRALERGNDILGFGK